ncbi:MAG: hypothetical protein KJ060_12765, partial [Candidatus Hydrogenedentes bacterium]|nr:hypothetical protein [Candidatus Hydrogenedentota bacterium]
MLVQTIYALAIVLTAMPTQVTIESFEDPPLPINLKMNNTVATLIDHDGGRALQVYFQVVDWPNVYFSAPDGTWDWSRARGLAVDVFNPGHEAANVAMRIDNPGTDGSDKSVTGQATALPGEWTELRTVFGPASIGPFWGMRGIAVAGPVGPGKSIDPAA